MLTASRNKSSISEVPVVLGQETLLRKYPHLTKNSRVPCRSEDSQESVSFEGFTHGEQMACSVNTLRLYTP